MNGNGFNRNSMAKRYALRHLKTDPATEIIYYLPTNSPQREIRLVEVNNAIVERDSDASQALDFGVDVGNPAEHKLLVVDVTPAQWKRIQRKELRLPDGWSLSDAVEFGRP